MLANHREYICISISVTGHRLCIFSMGCTNTGTYFR